MFFNTGFIIQVLSVTSKLFVVIQSFYMPKCIVLGLNVLVRLYAYRFFTHSGYPQMGHKYISFHASNRQHLLFRLV